MNRLSVFLLVGLGATSASLSVHSIPVHEPPRVKFTIPADSSRDVGPSSTIIVVGFDRAMRPDSWSLVPVPDHAYPELVGERPVVFPDAQTCVIQVRLRPNTIYGVSINSTVHTGFRSAEDDTPAEPYQLHFQTKGR